jgi:hypothetical protein
MAFTKTPETSTYKTVRFPFVGAFNTRDATGAKDQRYINCFPETVKAPGVKGQRVYLIKRPGLTTSISHTAGEARGCILWNSKVYSVVGNTLYSNTTNILTLGTSTGTVGFVAANGTIDYLFICDGTDGYVINTSDVVTQVNVTYTAWAATTAYTLGDYRIPTAANTIYYKVTTAGTSAGGEPAWPTVIGDTIVDGSVTWTAYGYYGGFPSPHITAPQYADGYLFLAAANSADIYNSDLDQPDSWQTSSFIVAEMYPDNIVTLSRQNNQVVAFGEGSTEFFYDAANATGSPLARNDGAAQQIGCMAKDATVSFERSMFFIGQSGIGGHAVWEIEGFKPNKVSLEWVDRALDAEQSGVANIKGFILRISGHQFYVINLSTRTLVYDTEEKMWSEWSTNSSGSHITFACNYSCDSPGYALLQHATNGKLYQFNPTIYQDDGTNILVEATTSPIDFETINQKTINRLSLVCDRIASSTLGYFSFSKDDYTTWSTPRSVDLSLRPFLTRVAGRFRRLAIKFTYADNYPVRIEDLEIDYNMGTN